MPSTQFSHLTPRELKKVLLTRLNAAATLRKETRQLRNRPRNVSTELFAIEFELADSKDIGREGHLAQQIRLV